MWSHKKCEVTKTLKSQNSVNWQKVSIRNKFEVTKLYVLNQWIVSRSKLRKSHVDMKSWLKSWVKVLRQFLNILLHFQGLSKTQQKSSFFWRHFPFGAGSSNKKLYAQNENFSNIQASTYTKCKVWWISFFVAIKFNDSNVLISTKSCIKLMAAKGSKYDNVYARSSKIELEGSKLSQTAVILSKMAAKRSKYHTVEYYYSALRLS